MTRQEAEYLDAEVKMLQEYKDKHCAVDCNGKWCIEHSSLMARIRYAQLYGCICGTCCRVCRDRENCGIDNAAVSCIDCGLNCGVNPKL